MPPQPPQVPEQPVVAPPQPAEQPPVMPPQPVEQPPVAPVVEPQPVAAPIAPAPEMAPVQPPQPAAAQQQDPSNTLGTVAIVLAVIAPLIGLILGLVARSQSKKAGFNGGRGKIAVIVGTIFVILSLLFGGLAAVLIAKGAHNDALSNDTYNANNAATELLQKISYYQADGGDSAPLPSSVNDLSKYSDSSITNDQALTGFTISTATPTSSTDLQYKKCDDKNAIVSYYDASAKKVQTTAVGESSTPQC